MKTNVIMTRQLNNYKVLQRTKDGYFDANALLHQWNQNNKRRRLDDFINSKSTKQFIEVLNEEITQGENSPMAFYQKKGRNTKKGKTKDEVWMHPYLFIDFAMWINPKFKLKVIKFVYDQLIKERHLAGDNYKVLSRAGCKLLGYNYPEVARALQWIVFNTNGKNLRQKASQEQLKELAQIQSNLAYSIDMGYIKSYKHLISELKKLWKQKYNSNEFAISA